MVEGIAHAFFEQCRLQPATSQLWNCCRTGEQRHSAVEAKRAGGTRLAIKLGEEAQTLLARRRNDAGLQQKFQKLGMFVRPACCADVGPELRLFGTRDS